MSLRTRARNLQRAAGIGYQQALARLRGLAEAPAVLAERSRWTLGRCDLFCVDRALDPEWREVHAGSTSIEERWCGRCTRLFFAGDGERFTHEVHCPACRLPCTKVALTSAPALRKGPTTMLGALRRILERAGATAVIWVPRHGGVVHSGERGAASILTLGAVRTHLPFEEWATELGPAIVLDGESVHVQQVGVAGVLVVIYDGGSSLGLVRLAVRDSLADVARLAHVGEPFVPPSGGTPPSAAPAHVAAGLAAWSAPLPQRRRG